jgi:hypothetical protein
MTTKTKTDCTTKGLCHYDSLTRTKFFHGMLLTDEHLRAEQTYHREALKRVNRHLWGSGIVCGLEVESTSGLCIKVHPGLALDCHGNVLDVCKCLTLDLSDLCKKKYPDGCAPSGAAPITTYLVLRYAEIAADPEPVLTPNDDCGTADQGTKCEASKYREGFCLEFCDKCPEPEPCAREEQGGKDPGQYGSDKYASAGFLASFLTLRQSTSPNVRDEMRRLQPDCMTSPPCPDCGCAESGVGLAKLEIDCDQNTVTVSCDCRQYVWSPRLLRWLVCGLLANVDKLPRNVVGLDQDAPPLPTASLAASQPLRSAWDAGTAFVAAPDRYNALETRVAELERMIKDTGPRQPGRRPKEP